MFNRAQNKYISQFDQPYAFNLSGNYKIPVFTMNSMAGKVVSWAVRDWTVGTFLGYASGLPIKAPTANNSLATLLFRSTFANRVPGQPLFTQDLNCHCFDPNKTFVLNPAAWTDPAAGQFGTSAAYYNDYRFQRRPAENMSLGRIFRIREKMTLNIRAEFSNIFNRTQLNDPVVTNAGATQTKVAATGQTTGGFGYINTGTTFAPPRQGTIVARFTF